MSEDPVGAVLAGGRGRRLGGDKATVELEGRALISYAVDALRTVVDEVAVVVKAETELPELSGVHAIWIESEEDYHPLHGVVHALAMAAGRPVLVCPADLPLVTERVLRALLDADTGAVAAVVARAGGRLQPLVGLYTPLALPALTEIPPDATTRDVVLGLAPVIVDVDDEDAFYNVNAPEDLLRAAALLASRR